MPGTRRLDLPALVSDFADRLTEIVELSVIERVRMLVVDVLDGKGPRLRGSRRPAQLCPVPGCQNRAAPVFGMVCAEHKNVSKAKIKVYRQQRRAAKTAEQSGA